MNNDLLAKLKVDGTIEFSTRTRLYQGSSSFYKLTITSVGDIDSNSVMYIQFRREDGQETSIIPMTRVSGTNSFYFNLNSQWYFYVAGNLYFNIQIRKELGDDEVQVISQSNSSLYINAVSGFNAPAPLTPQAIDVIEQDIIDLDNSKIDKTSIVLTNSASNDDTQVLSAKASHDNLVDKTFELNGYALSGSSLDLDADDLNALDSLGATKTIQEVLDSKLDDTQLAQVIDESTTKAPSNKAVFDGLASKLDDSQLVQSVDNSVTNIPSTAAITSELSTYVEFENIGEEDEILVTVTGADKLLQDGEYVEAIHLNVNSALDSESAEDVTTSINSHLLSDIFESDGVTVKAATTSSNVNGYDETDFKKVNTVIYSGDYESKAFSPSELYDEVSDSDITAVAYWTNYRRVSLQLDLGELELSYPFDSTMGTKRFRVDFKYKQFILGNFISIRDFSIYFKIYYDGTNFTYRTETNAMYLDLGTTTQSTPAITEIFLQMNNTTDLTIEYIRFNTLIGFATSPTLNPEYKFSIVKITEIGDEI